MLRELHRELEAYLPSQWFFILLVVIFIFHKWVLSAAWFSPLSKIPAAHPLASFTLLWMTWKRYSGKEFCTIESAFQKKGQIVRLGPRELGVNYIEGIRTVYGRGYHKTSWYEHFINYGQRTMFTTYGDMHGAVRRRISSVFTKSFLQASPHFQAMISTVLQTRLIPILTDHYNHNNDIDMLELSLAYGIDIITATIFGLPCGTNLLQDLDYRDWLFAKFNAYSAGNSFWLNDVPELTARLKSIGLNPVKPGYYRAQKELEDWCLTLVRAAEKLVTLNASKKDVTPGEKPIVFEKLWLAVEEEAKTNRGSLANPVSLCSADDRRLEVASECLDHILATREDFGITLSSIFHRISQSPYCQLRIQQELHSISTADALLPSPKALESLRFFNAAIKEGLRLRPNLPSPNPRMTTPDAPSTIGPYTDIPPGTRVVAFSRCLHRNERVFSDPNAFVPDRWLRPDKVETAEEKEQNGRVDLCEESFWAFSSGTRMCLASNMSMELIRMVVAAVYLHFSTSVEDDATYGIHGGIVEGGPGERLLLKLSAVQRH